jgi:hypothetical protein
MHAPCHRRLHQPHAMLCRQRPQPQDVVAPQGRVLDPGGPRLHPGQHLAQHRFRHGRRGQAGDHPVPPPRRLRRSLPPAAPRAPQAARPPPHPGRTPPSSNPPARQTGGERPQISQPDECVAHSAAPPPRSGPGRMPMRNAGSASAKSHLHLAPPVRRESRRAWRRTLPAAQALHPSLPIRVRNSICIPAHLRISRSHLAGCLLVELRIDPSVPRTSRGARLAGTTAPPPRRAS